ncbi:hypothetical protein Tco_0180227 [Tanacetum coccineum]
MKKLLFDGSQEVRLDTVGVTQLGSWPSSGAAMYDDWRKAHAKTPCALLTPINHHYTFSCNLAAESEEGLELRRGARCVLRGEPRVREISFYPICGPVARGYLSAKVRRDQQLPPGYPGRVPGCGRPHSTTGTTEKSHSQDSQARSEDPSEGGGNKKGWIRRSNPLGPWKWRCTASGHGISHSATGQVAMGSQLRLRFKQEVRLLKKATAKIARRDQRIQVGEGEIKRLDQEIKSLRTVEAKLHGLCNRTKNLETLLEAEVDMKKVAEAKNAGQAKELESLRV